jgi:hypothetical protein
VTGSGEGGSGRSPGWNAAALALAGLLLLAFAPLFAGKNILPFEKYPNWGTAPVKDAGGVFQPDRAFQARKAAASWVVDSDFVGLSLYWPQDLLIARSLREGRLPLWDPTRGGGYPTFDNGQFRPFNPFRLPFWALPSNGMYSLSLALCLVFGVWGAWVWLRKEGHGTAEALLGAGVFALNPWVLERLPVQEPAAYFFLPWILLALRQVRWREPLTIALPALAVTAMAHVGQPEPCLLVTVIASMHYLIHGTAEETQWRGLGKRAALLGAVGLCTLATLAVLWVPLVRLSTLSFTYKKAGLPFIIESSWWAPVTVAADFFVAPGLLALLAASLASRKGRPWFWLGLALFGLLALMPIPLGGSRLKTWLQLSVFVIPLTNFKLIFWAGLSFALPQGLHALRDAARRAGVAAAVAGFFGLGMVALAAARFPVALGDQTRLPLVAALALLAGPTALLVCAFRPRWDGSGAVRAALLLLPLAFPISLDHLGWNRTPRVESDLAAWVRSERPHERVLSTGIPFALPPDSGQAVGVRCGEMNAAYFPNDYFQLFFRPPAPPTLIAFRDPEIVRFRQMGATLMLVPSELAPRGQQAARSGKWASAFEIPDAQGRLFFAEEVAPRQAGKGLTEQIMEAGKGSDGAVVVETVGQPAPAPWPATRRGEGRLSFVSDGPEEIVIEAEAPDDSLLVLRDTWYPGWRATVDGAGTTIYKANGCFRAVRVPAGRHQVRFVYCPVLVYASGALSLAATLLLLTAAFLGPRRRGPGSEEAPGPAS